MHKDDAEKTDFITSWGVYNYKVMYFGLKNVSAAYMKAMNTLFHNLIHKKIEVYVADVIIKSKEILNHLDYLHQFFARLHKYSQNDESRKMCLWCYIWKYFRFLCSH